MTCLLVVDVLLLLFAYLLYCCYCHIIGMTATVQVGDREPCDIQLSYGSLCMASCCVKLGYLIFLLDRICWDISQSNEPSESDLELVLGKLCCTPLFSRCFGHGHTPSLGCWPLYICSSQKRVEPFFYSVQKRVESSCHTPYFGC